MPIKQSPTKSNLGNIPEVLIKAQRYCAYQERSQKEVRDKLKTLRYNSAEIEQSLAWLIENNYLNEERFAAVYAGGKFRIKSWGKIKIRLYLQRKGVSEPCIRKGLQAISSKEYSQTINKIIAKRILLEKDKSPVKQKYAIAKYLISQGFESELVWDALQHQFSDSQD